MQEGGAGSCHKWSMPLTKREKMVGIFLFAQVCLSLKTALCVQRAYRGKSEYCPSLPGSGYMEQFTGHRVLKSPSIGSRGFTQKRPHCHIGWARCQAVYIEAPDSLPVSRGEETVRSVSHALNHPGLQKAKQAGEIPCLPTMLLTVVQLSGGYSRQQAHARMR